MALRFLIDHCVPRSVETALAINAHDALRLTSLLPSTTPDDQVLAGAISEGRILVTIDHDFGDIVRYPPFSHHAHYEGLLFLVEPHRIRIRT